MGSEQDGHCDECSDCQVSADRRHFCRPLGPDADVRRFPASSRHIPLIGGEDANVFGCTWEKLHEENPKSSFQFTTSSAEQWNIRLAIQWAIASAADGKSIEPLVITDTKGVKHTVANPGDKIVKNFTMDDFLKGEIYCLKELPESAGNGTSLTIEQTLRLVEGRSLIPAES